MSLVGRPISLKLLGPTPLLKLYKAKTIKYDLVSSLPPAKDVLQNFLQKLVSTLNSDLEMRYRARRFFKPNDPSILSITIPDLELVFTIGLQNGKFTFKEGKEGMPILEIKIPLKQFTRMLLNEETVVEALIEDGSELISNPERYNHDTGATIIELLVVAQELVERDEELKKSITSIGGGRV